MIGLAKIASGVGAFFSNLHFSINFLHKIEIWQLVSVEGIEIQRDFQLCGLEKIAENILQSVFGGTMSRKSIRLEDLAALANMSTATVSRALNDNPNVNDATKRKIWQLAREHGYLFRPNMPHAPSGAQATISLVIPPAQGRERSADDAFFQSLIGGVSAAARSSNCDVLLSHISPRNIDDLQDLISAPGVDGAIFLGQSFLHDALNALASQGHRFVVWGAALPGQLYCSVGSDNVRGGRRAVDHLLRLGRKKIVFLGDTDEPEIQRRFQGYRAALAAANVLYRGDLVSTVHFEIESAHSTVERLLAQKIDFDALFAASDMAAIGAIRALRQAGLRVPEDVAVVGYDDVTMGRYIRPQLTTIRQDLSEAGRLMVSKLLSASDTRDLASERLATDLIVRESCGS